MINIDRLNVFLHVAETQNFSSAAQRLHISQPTVSKQIKELENELKAELFIRSSSGVQLTDAGKTLIPWARKLVRDNLELQTMMGALDQEITGYLKIACSTTAGKYILPQLAVRFREKNPGVRISLLPCTQENISIKLLAGDVDLGVSSIEMDQSGLDCQHFFTDHVALIVPNSHPWSERNSVEPDDLLGQPILMREPTSGTRRVLLSELAKFDITLEDLSVVLEVGNAEAIVFSVAAGLGISFVSKVASSYCRAWGCTVHIPIDGFNLRRDICIARKTMGSPNRAMEAFWGFIHTPENADLLRLPEL